MPAAKVTSTGDAIIHKTLDGTVVSWNDAAERMFGYSEKEMIGQTIRHLIPADRQQEEDAILAEIAVGHQITHFETVRLHKDGRALDVIVTISPGRDKAGTITGATKIARDLSALKLVEERFRESGAKLLATFENAAVGMAHVAPSGAWMLVNRCLSEITGYSKDELLSKTFQDLTHPEDLPADLVQLQRMLNGEINSYRTEKRYLRKDGPPVWVKLTVSCVRNAQGAVDYFISVVEDISKQKQAEELLQRQTEALRESEARLRAIVSTAADAIIVIDEAGKILSVNPACGRIFGYAPDELLGKNTSVLMPEPDRSLHDRFLSDYLRTGIPKIIGIGREVKHLRKDGSVFDAELSVTEWQACGKRYFTGIIRDISERKRQEEKIQLLVREVSHRAKNMLSVVQTVARRTVAATSGDFIERFEDRIQSLAASQDLLVTSDWRGADLGDLIRSQLGHFRDLIGARIELSGPHLFINASAAQTLGMALHELATNAGKYGALAKDCGRICIEWSSGPGDAGNEVFLMSWRERGGNPVSPPSKLGFGSTVLGRMVRETLEGKVELEFEYAGLSWQLECPAVNVLGSG